MTFYSCFLPITDGVVFTSTSVLTSLAIFFLFTSCNFKFCFYYWFFLQIKVFYVIFLVVFIEIAVIYTTWCFSIVYTSSKTISISFHFIHLYYLSKDLKNYFILLSFLKESESTILWRHDGNYFDHTQFIEISAVIWLKYCRYGAKYYQSIN